MYLSKLSFLLLLLTRYSQPHALKASGVALEKGKPIQLPKKYESVQLVGLSGTLYTDSLSQLVGVKELKIDRHRLKTIEKGALCSAPDLKILHLDLDGSEASLKHLTKDMFYDCDRIEELLLKFDSGRSAYTIDDDAFDGLTNVKKVAVQPSDVKDMVLSFNDIEQVSDVFDSFKNLERVVVRHNKNWAQFHKGLFKGLPKLKEVHAKDLAWNDLEWSQRNSFLRR